MEGRHKKAITNEISQLMAQPRDNKTHSSLQVNVQIQKGNGGAQLPVCKYVTKQWAVVYLKMTRVSTASYDGGIVSPTTRPTGLNVCFPP